MKTNLPMKNKEIINAIVYASRCSFVDKKTLQGSA